jgi:hypothetical protein
MKKLDIAALRRAHAGGRNRAPSFPRVARLQDGVASFAYVAGIRDLKRNRSKKKQIKDIDGRVQPGPARP